MFKSVDIENFRGIKKLHVGGLGRVNLLVGKNNSGKTTVLESLLMLAYPSNSAVPVMLNSQRQLSPLIQNYWRLLFFDQEQGHSTNTRLKSEQSNGEKRTLSLYPYINRESTLTINELQNRTGNGGVNTDDLTRGGLTMISGEDDGVAAEGYQVDAFFEGNNLKMKNHGEPKLETITAAYISAGIASVQNELVVSALSQLIVDKQVERLVAVLNQIDSSIQNVALGKDNLIYIDIGLPKSLPVNVMGDGTLKALSIMLFLSSAKNGILLIDEIDSGLHYSALEVIWKAVFAAAKEFNVQVFATTHSWECITAFSKTEGLEEGETKLFRITKKGEENFATDYTHEILQGAVEGGIEVRGS